MELLEEKHKLPDRSCSALYLHCPEIEEEERKGVREGVRGRGRGRVRSPILCTGSRSGVIILWSIDAGTSNTSQQHKQKEENEADEDDTQKESQKEKETKEKEAGKGEVEVGERASPILKEIMRFSVSDDGVSAIDTYIDSHSYGI